MGIFGYTNPATEIEEELVSKQRLMTHTLPQLARLLPQGAEILLDLRWGETSLSLESQAINYVIPLHLIAFEAMQAMCMRSWQSISSAVLFIHQVNVKVLTRLNVVLTRLNVVQAMSHSDCLMR